MECFFGSLKNEYVLMTGDESFSDVVHATWLLQLTKTA